MSQAAIQTSPNPNQAPVPPLPVPPQLAARTAWQKVRGVLGILASLRLTVILFALSLFLVFCGTLAQVELGLGTAVESYFRSAFVMIPFQLFVKFGQVFFGISKEAHIAGSFPFPGGWLLGGLLLVNLLAAHAVRFKMSWNRSGIFLIHFGLIVMMLSELVTGLFAVEARMTIATGETVKYIEVVGDPELAFTYSGDPKNDDVMVIPNSILKKRGLIQDSDLPVDVQVLEYTKNSSLVSEDKAPAEYSDAKTYVSAVRARFKLIPRSEESGAASEGAGDHPAVWVRFLKKGTNESLGEMALSLWFDRNVTNRIPAFQFPPQRLRVGEKTYKVELRPKRVYKDYSLHLVEFTHEVYIGTDVPKNFASQLVLTDPTRHENREVKISMNDPLRYGGETFYQSGYLPGNKGTVLQVVKNPGWLMPYLSCVLVSAGMLFHFGLHLVTFLRRRVA